MRGKRGKTCSSCGAPPGRGARGAAAGGRATLDALDGEWYVEQLRKICLAHGLEDRVVWTGPFDSDSDEGSAYLCASDVAVFPFLYGVKLCQHVVAAAASHGLPIVGLRGITTPRARSWTG